MRGLTFVSVISTIFLTACGPDGNATGSSTDTDTGTQGETGSESDTTTAGPDTESETESESDTEPDSETDSGAEAMGCDGTPLRANPTDPAAVGPWPVGVASVQIEGLDVEIWYPATPGSEAGAEQREYDIRTKLPEAEGNKVPDEANPWQPCDCYHQLPIDGDHGPYPVILFVHGTAGFASQSLELMTHWASRGFIVAAADHPGLMLGDLLGSLCGITPPAQDLGGDLAKVANALSQPSGSLDFLEGHVDSARIGMAGHSAGGNAISGQGDLAQVLVPMGAGGTSAGSVLQSTLVLGAQEDAIVAYDSQTSGYDNAPAPKRLVGIANAGHLAFSSLCSLENASNQDFLEIAAEYDICGAQFAGFLFDCKDSYLADTTSWSIINYASSSVFEETLHCRPEAADWLTQIESAYDDVFEYREAL